MMIKQLLFLYLIIINAAAFALMLVDKQKARRKKWRIRESVLIGSALVGGSIGAWLGMQIFRHKTLHKKFCLGIPAIIGIQTLIGIVYWYYFV